MNRRLWTPREIRTIKRLYPSGNIHTLEKELDPRTRSGIYRKAQRLQLHKDNYETIKHYKKIMPKKTYFLGITADYIVGFVDGEGSFYAGKNIGFDISNTDYTTLKQILEWFIAHGYLRKNIKYLRKMYNLNNKPVWHLEVRAPIDMLKIAYFFSMHGVLTKREQFRKWKKRLMEMNGKWLK